MKKELIASFLLTMTSAYAKINVDSKPATDVEWSEFLEAHSQLESNGRTDICKLDTNHKYSYGCLQIQWPYLQDSRLPYTMADMFDKDKSFEVAKAYMTRYAASYEKRTGKPATYEVLARIHNGGPRGAERSATNAYWQKVKVELNKEQ